MFTPFRLGLRKHVNRFFFTPISICFLQWPYREKEISRYRLPSHHYTLLPLFPLDFICSSSLLFYWDSWHSQAHPPLHGNTCTYLQYRQVVIQNSWKITKTQFRFLISQELSHRDGALGTSHGTVLQRWKSGICKHKAPLKMTDLRE